jgi:hypothetical protein
MDQIITEGTSKVISGNNIITTISVNRGTLSVTGNNCDITVLCNIGTIMYTGNNSCIDIGSSNRFIVTEKYEGRINITSNNVKLNIGANCCTQKLKFVGVGGVLKLSQYEEVLNGYVRMKIKHGNATIRQPKVKQSIVNVTAPQQQRCGLYISGASNINVNQLPSITVNMFRRAQ